MRALLIGVIIGWATGIVAPTQAQVPLVPPTPLYYIEFFQPAGSPAGNSLARVVSYGPATSLAACLADLQVIMAAPTGLGSTAWSWQPVVICYHVP